MSEPIRGLVEIAEDALTLAGNGNYSNGNEAYGVDEGRVRAGEMLDRLRVELNKAKAVKITYRGWPGHFCAVRHCTFRLNTLLEQGDVRMVVSTVGNMQVDSFSKAEEVAIGRYYETMAFRAALHDGYWDQDSGCDVPLHGKWTVKHINIKSDQEAQDMHEAAVKEIAARMLAGEFSGIPAQEPVNG